jgi:hypothetical protein
MEIFLDMRNLTLILRTSDKRNQLNYESTNDCYVAVWHELHCTMEKVIADDEGLRDYLDTLESDFGIKTWECDPTLMEWYRADVPVPVPDGLKARWVAAADMFGFRDDADV